MRAAERVCEASREEQANETAVRANKRTDERVAQYFRPNSWLFCPTVHSSSEFELTHSNTSDTEKHVNIHVNLELSTLQLIVPSFIMSNSQA